MDTCDNNIPSPLQINDEADLLNLNKIAGKTIKNLCEENEGLLVFPKVLNEYKDDIDKGVIFEINKNQLYTNNIMGFIGVGDTQLKIGSRFDQGRCDLFMQYMLARVLSINMFDLQYSFSQDSIFDFSLFLFPFFLKKALAQGIYKTFKTYERNDMKLRGVLDVNRHIRLNYPITTAVAYKAREKTYDNEITQLIRHTIEHIKSTPYGTSILNCDDETKEGVMQITQATGSYSSRERTSIINKNLKPKIHPYYSEYEPLRKLCMQILRHDEIKYGKDKERVYGVLFDGAWLWEEYLSTIMPQGIQHPKNKERKGGFSLFTNKGAWRYPDFWGDGIVLDAKYKRYGDTDIWNVDRDDLAQIISYMYVESAKVGIVLCPVEHETCPSTATLRGGYRGQMVRLSLPISKALNFRGFRDDMANNESRFSEEIESQRRTVVQIPKSTFFDSEVVDR